MPRSSVSVAPGRLALLSAIDEGVRPRPARRGARVRRLPVLEVARGGAVPAWRAHRGPGREGRGRFGAQASSTRAGGREGGAGAARQSPRGRRAGDSGARAGRARAGADPALGRGFKVVGQGDDLSRPDVVHLDLGNAQEASELSQEDIDGRFRAEEGAILDCISQARPDAETYVPGRVTIKFRIQRAGTVRGVRVEAPAGVAEGRDLRLHQGRGRAAAVPALGLEPDRHVPVQLELRVATRSGPRRRCSGRPRAARGRAARA